ncbi:ADP-ribosylglycohydrolase family protein [Photobacterium sagamiensis]|uniref:ADP-ribosylglycohydrolase family protein n=1 Tax=Photobacterium sagamiensis TaxID=2910241 RepID=UPI003D131C2B
MTKTAVNDNSAALSRIQGCLFGQAYGDALGMPSELWTKSRVENYFGWIDSFLVGPEENIAANEFAKGQYTDDTSQAIALVEAVIEADGEIDPKIIAKHIIKWANDIDAFNKNILGPTSKKTLNDIAKGIEIEEIESNGVTNGSAMRISPVGCLLKSDDLDQFINSVRLSCIATHKSDIAIAGATAIAWCISRAIDGFHWDSIKGELCEVSNLAQEKYQSTFSPLLGYRINYAMDLIAELKKQRDEASKEYKEDVVKVVYEQVGSGMDIIESIPAAIALVEASDTDPLLCAELAANLGGDTDTIGAMATAICGAIHGIQAFPTDSISLIEEVNNTNFNLYAGKLTEYRLNKKGENNENR